MNKKYLMGFIACAALTVTSCSNDEVMDAALQQEAKAIQFSTYLGRDVETKGAITDLNGLKGEGKGFGITAFYTGNTQWTSWTPTAPNFMYNQKVTSTDGTKWTYTPIKYWPTRVGDKISFFAYAPYVTNTTAPMTGTIDGTNAITLPTKNASENVTSLTFNLTTEAKNMVDFVAAQVIDATQNNYVDATSTPGDNTIKFALKHELSRLTFQVKTSMKMAEESTVVLKSAELVKDENCQTYQSAIYTFNNASTSNETSTRGTWGSQVAITNNYNLESVIDWDEETTINKKNYGGGAKVKAFDSNTTPVELFKTDEYLFLIPVDGGLTANKSAIKFTYDIVTEDSNLSSGYSCTEATKTVYLPAGILQQGKAYNVTFTFNVDEIEVSATVDPWTIDTPDKEATVPFTPDAPTGGGN